MFQFSKKLEYLCSGWFFIQSIFADRNNSFQQKYLDLLNNLHPFQEGGIVKKIEWINFSTNQNAEKLEFTIESSVLIYCNYL